MVAMAHTFFQYVPKKTILHIIPPAPKLVAMVILAIAAFYCPTLPALFLWLLLILVSKALLHLRISSLLADVRPVLIYAALLYLSSLIVNCYSLFSSTDTIQKESITLTTLLYPTLARGGLLARIALSLQISSLFYRTTSATQLYEGFSQLEYAITRKKYGTLSNALSLTLTFIPRIAFFWERIDMAYMARGGKRGIRRILCLTPVLFRVSMNEAWQKTLARENRLP